MPDPKPWFVGAADVPIDELDQTTHDNPEGAA